jgi:tripartite-type tricarboxylate transporter receptor subunit TctC
MVRVGAGRRFAPARAPRALRYLILPLLLPAGAALAQDYPSRPIRLIVGFAAGGPADTTARILAHRLSDRIGVNVVVDNRPGATGVIAADTVAKAVPDGHTVLLCASGLMVTNPLLMPKTPFDPARDFAPVSMVVSIPFVLFVNPASPVANVRDLIALARSRPGALNYGTAGAGSSSHLASVLFSTMAGIQAVHVPYKGSALAANDLVAGQLHFIFEAIAAGMQFVKSGRLRALGVATAQRIAVAPELPTIAEAGMPGFEASVWHGICAPAATPPARIERLGREIVATAVQPDVRERYTAIGTEVIASDPAQFRAALRAEIARWEKLVRETGFRL